MDRFFIPFIFLCGSLSAMERIERKASEVPPIPCDLLQIIFADVIDNSATDKSAIRTILNFIVTQKSSNPEHSLGRSKEIARGLITKIAARFFAGNMLKAAVLLRNEGARAWLQEAAAHDQVLKDQVNQMLCEKERTLSEMRFLLDAGADVDGIGRNGLPPVILLLNSSNAVEKLHLLKASGATLDGTFLHPRYSILHMALLRQAPLQVISWLLMQLNRPNLSTPLHGQTVLMEAAEMSNRDALRILLDAGAPINQTDYEGHTALWYAAVRSGDMGIVDYLVERGALIDHELLQELEAIVSHNPNSRAKPIMRYLRSKTSSCTLS